MIACGADFSGVNTKDNMGTLGTLKTELIASEGYNNQTKPIRSHTLHFLELIAKKLKIRVRQFKNIARGTTDPEIDSETWTKLGNNMAPLALIANLAKRWRHLTLSHLITFSH